MAEGSRREAFDPKREHKRPSCIHSPTDAPAITTSCSSRLLGTVVARTWVADTQTNTPCRLGRPLASSVAPRAAFHG